MTVKLNPGRLNLVGSQYSKEKNYWLNKLSGVIESHCLPYDRTGNTDEQAMKTLQFEIPVRLSNRLMEIAGGSDIRLHMILTAGLVVLLHKYSDQKDILVGIPIYKQKLEGEFTNTVVVVRNLMEESATFKTLIIQVKQSITEAMENANYPIEKLLHHLNMSSSRGCFPLFEAALLLENIHEREYLRHIRGNMTFSFRRTGEHLGGILEYNAPLFRETTVKRISGHFLELLSNAIFCVDSPISAINILPEEEKKQVLYEFNDNRVEGIGDKTIHRLFEEQAAKSPDRTAVVFEGKESTYRGLNENANRLARVLRNKGVYEDRLAGILLDRSPRMVECILAIWKARGAYIPMETQYPTQRILGILNDSSSRILLTREEFVNDEIEKGYKGKILKLEKDMNTIKKKNPSNLDLKINMRSLAYVFYTSGSTGKPKGAMVEHIGMINHNQAKINDLLLTGESIIAQNASHTFDISVWEFFAPLTLGGKTAVYPYDLILEPNRFIHRIIKDRVTVLEVVPSYLLVLLDVMAETHWKFEYLNYLVVTGEEIKHHLVKRWFEKYPGIKMVNGYGPTEAAKDVAHYIMDKLPERERIPIGKPVQNLNIYIVDKNMHPCPIGVIGEICASGIGVGRGYLNNQQKTRHLFLEDPFTGKRGVRLYKTGDLGRWLPDGTIEFLGRKDYQVKIRGFRIELEEIENKLITHPHIKNAVVVDREDESGNKYLCAYFVSTDSEKLNQSHIKAYLSEHLPDYMIPAYLVHLEQMPLSPNGKTDRKALPEPTAYSRGIPCNHGGEYQSPRNPVEEKLAEIWAQVLGREKISINEKLFDIGGDSIKTIQIASRISKAGYRVEMKDIFRHPTIAQLAPFLKKSPRVIDQSTVTGIVPLTPIQEAFFSGLPIGPCHYNMSVLLFSGERLEEKAVRVVFTRIQEHHDALRMTFKRSNGEIIQTDHGFEYPLELKEFDLVDMAHPEAVAALEHKANEIQRSICLEEGPLMKLGLFHLDDGDRVLIIIHHLVVDGVSWRILLEDIGTLFRQYKNNEPLTLHLKSDSFKTWAEQLSKYANSQLFLQEKVYWADLEATIVPRIENDFPEQSNYTKDNEILTFRLSKEDTELLLTTVNNAFGTEINDILITALGLAVKSNFGIHRVLIELEGHGREEILEDIDTKRTVGWFTSGYPIISDVSYEHDFARQIKEVKENLHRVPHKGIGYGILKYLTAEEHKKDIKFQLDPQICFNYLGQFDEDLNQTAFRLAKEKTGDHQAPASIGKYQFIVLGMIMNKRLEMSISYNKKHFKKQTIENFLNHLESKLIHIISFCSEREDREFTPSDFGYKEISIEQLDSIFD